MLISVDQLARYWGLRPNRILHIGAHAAEERESYAAAGWGKDMTVWVEADPESVAVSRMRVGNAENVAVVEALAWDQTGEELDFWVTSNGESSSALPLAEHADLYPSIEVVGKLALKSVALSECDGVAGRGPYGFVNLDIQGAELRALVGLGALLDNVDAVYCEVFTRPLYTGLNSLHDVDDYLGGRGFIRVDLDMTSDGWGDGLWLRHHARPRGVRMRRLARRAEARLRRIAGSTKRRWVGR